MRFLLVLLFFATAYLARADALDAALLWTVGIAFLHLYEEATGQLWKYFGRVAGFGLLGRIPSAAGFLLIVAPAFALQFVAALAAFSGATVAVFWLALLIGARLGDGIFSHAVPFAQGHQPLSVQGAAQTQLNPGLGTGIIYLVDGLVLALLWHAPLLANADLALKGFTIGAGFFALVLPSLQLLGLFERKRA